MEDKYSRPLNKAEQNFLKCVCDLEDKQPDAINNDVTLQTVARFKVGNSDEMIARLHAAIAVMETEPDSARKSLYMATLLDFKNEIYEEGFIEQDVMENIEIGDCDDQQPAKQKVKRSRVNYLKVVDNGFNKEDFERNQIFENYCSKIINGNIKLEENSEIINFIYNFERRTDEQEDLFAATQLAIIANNHNLDANDRKARVDLLLFFMNKLPENQIKTLMIAVLQDFQEELEKQISFIQVPTSKSIN